jgi:stage IV sporulation protein FB
MEESDFYPPKPELIDIKKGNNSALTFFSIALFLLFFLFFFSDKLSLVFALIGVLLIHELGHYWVMKIYNYQQVRILFVPMMGAFVQGKKEEYSQKESLLVTVAGPFPGVLIGFLLLISASYFQFSFLVDMGVFFLVLNLVNLVPLDPLDGGQLFKLLTRKNQDFFSLVFALISSLVLIGVGWLLDSWAMMLFGFFMGIRVRSFQNKLELRKDLREEEVNYQTSYSLLSNRDFSRIKNLLLDKSPALRSYIDMSTSEESEQFLASQVNNLLLNPIKKDASMLLKAIIILFWVASLAFPFVIYFFYKDFLFTHYEWYFKLFSVR